MKTGTLPTKTAFLAATVFSLLSLHFFTRAHSLAHDEKPIAITVKRGPEAAVFELDSQPKRIGELLESLGKLSVERGRDYPVVALVEDDASLSDVSDALAIPGKAGFRNVRAFAVYRETGKMAEIHFCPAIPISSVPPATSNCKLSQ